MEYLSNLFQVPWWQFENTQKLPVQVLDDVVKENKKQVEVISGGIQKIDLRDYINYFIHF